FNVSHSGGMILVAVASDRRVGVDIERVRSDFDVVQIAERFFSPAEHAALRKVPLPGKAEAFFRCWTRKEAFIKALGEGLSHPLHQFDVGLDGTEPIPLSTRPDPQEARRWSLWSLPAAAGYVAAVAVENIPTREP
ncbi:MAG: 4'-phosphopantetheinyl transferase superfamily protein, partial [Acidobacteriales bacterium]|nr:4'-phosphopantetheinyl transferase superfamily protein [Terriglobales bacterium]